MTAGEQLVWKLKKESWEAGEKQGWEDGKKQGWEDGINAEKLQIAKSMKDSDIELPIIMKCTGLTSEQIENL